MQPNLKMLGASDMWAVMRWSGIRAQLHDFIDGEEGQPTASELLFEWVWKHFRRHQVRAADARSGGGKGGEGGDGKGGGGTGA